MCNRAYLKLYPASPATAPTLTGIIDGGAFILGKIKLSSCRQGKNQLSPLTTNLSSILQGMDISVQAGAVAAVAAYDWIDIGIGIDSQSVAHPILERNADL